MKKIASLIFTLLLFACQDKRESMQVVRNDLVEAIYSSIIVEPTNVYQVNASVSGYIDELYFNEGDLIKQGDAICLIVNKTSMLNEANAKLSYKQLKDSYTGKSNILDEMRTELQTLRMKFEVDSNSYKRMKYLFSNGSCSRAEYENALLNYELSKNNYQNADKRLIRKENELNSQVEQYRNNLEISSIKNDDYLIKSLIDGCIFQIFKKKGEYVSMQEPLAIVGDADNYVLKMKIDEVDISKVTLGQKVLVTLEAFKDKVFEAKITKVYPKMDDRTQTFEIEAMFVKSPSKLFMGLTGEGNIVINENKNALVIPREYLMAGNKVETESGLITVETGLSNWSHVEIKKGLKEGATILKPR